MRRVQVLNRNRALLQPLEVEYCASFLCKLRGLSWQRHLAPERGLLMAEPAESRLNSAIHMLGMAFDLSIIWLDNDLRVVDVRPARRWRSFLTPRKAARYVIECRLERLEEFQIGDQIELQDIVAA